MKVVIASCFESNEERMGFVYEACKSRGYDTVALTSDFSHIKKKKEQQFLISLKQFQHVHIRKTCL